MEPTKIAMLYATVDGHTFKICERILHILAEAGNQVELFEITNFDQKISDYDLVFIGASIRYGKHSKQVIHFVNAHQRELEEVKSAFFSVNLVARKPEKSTPETNPYVIKFFQSINWKPDASAVFAGVLDYPRYGFFDKLMIKLIMKITGGPTSGDGPIEYIDWGHVEQFAKKLARTVNIPVHF